MARVLVTEEIAASGLELLRNVGHTVDVQLGLTPDELLDVIPGAAGLIVRSATKVTAEVLSAGSELVAVGRAGVGLDNVDVAKATANGVMVINAPHSNVLSAAEHTMALILAQARNVPQAHAALKEGRWERSQWTGVELSDKTLGIVGLGRIGTLVAERARAFGMHLVAYDPFVPTEKAAALKVEMVELDDLMSRSDFVTLHLAKTPETIGLINAELLTKAKPTMRIVNVARGGIIDEADLAEAISVGTIAGAGIDVFDTEPKTESPLFALDSVVVTPHLGASTVEAQDKAGVTIAEQLQLALAGDFVPFAVNVAASPADEQMRPYIPLCEQLGRLFAGLARSTPAQVDIEFIGEIGTSDNQLATLSVIKGLMAASGLGEVSYVNAADVAKSRGMTFRTINTPSAEDHVNLISIRAGSHSISGTLTSATRAPRIVGIDGHSLDLPVAANMLVIHNQDQPGMIGHVSSTLGDAGININDMAVGQSQTGPSIMVVITDQVVPGPVSEAIVGGEGIVSATSIGI